MLRLPARPASKRTVSTAVVAVLLLAVFGFDLGRGLGRAPLLDLVASAWPALLGTLAAVGLLALSGRRADRAWLLPLGATSLAVGAGTALSDLTTAWWAWWQATRPRDGAFLAVGVRVPADGTVQVAALQVSVAVETAVALAGPALLVIGVLHRSRDTVPV